MAWRDVMLEMIYHECRNKSSNFYLLFYCMYHQV
jgi:hypothetical protein